MNYHDLENIACKWFHVLGTSRLDFQDMYFQQQAGEPVFAD